MTPCKCGYQDHRFCPLHGRALRKVIKAAHELGAEAAERVAEAFDDTDGDGHDVEDVCLGCATGALDHDDANGAVMFVCVGTAPWVAPRICRACLKLGDAVDRILSMVEISP